MSKERIRELCKMNHFEDFFIYLQSFMEELQGEGLSVRLRKEQKRRILSQRMERDNSL